MGSSALIGSDADALRAQAVGEGRVLAAVDDLQRGRRQRGCVDAVPLVEQGLVAGDGDGAATDGHARASRRRSPRCRCRRCPRSGCGRCPRAPRLWTTPTDHDAVAGVAGDEVGVDGTADVVVEEDTTEAVDPGAGVVEHEVVGDREVPHRELGVVSSTPVPRTTHELASVPPLARVTALPSKMLLVIEPLRVMATEPPVMKMWWKEPSRTRTDAPVMRPLCTSPDPTSRSHPLQLNRRQSLAWAMLQRVAAEVERDPRGERPGRLVAGDILGEHHIGGDLHRGVRSARTEAPRPVRHRPYRSAGRSAPRSQAARHQRHVESQVLLTEPAGRQRGVGLRLATTLADDLGVNLK